MPAVATDIVVINPNTAVLAAANPAVTAAIIVPSWGRILTIWATAEPNSKPVPATSNAMEPNDATAAPPSAILAINGSWIVSAVALNPSSTARKCPDNSIKVPPILFTVSATCRFASSWTLSLRLFTPVAAPSAAVPIPLKSESAPEIAFAMLFVAVVKRVAASSALISPVDIPLI